MPGESNLSAPAITESGYLRMALGGHDKAGKSYTSLELATTLIDGLKERGADVGNGRVLVVDTEHKSILKYLGIFDFDYRFLTNYHPDNYIKVMREAESKRYPIVILDSISHEWAGKGGILEIHQELIKKLGKKAQFTAWQIAKGVHHNAFIETFLALNCHIVSTIRFKVKHRIQDGQIQKLGFKPIQQNEIGFEFDIFGRIDTNHAISFDGTRVIMRQEGSSDLVSPINNRTFSCPREEIAKGRGPGRVIAPILADWLCRVVLPGDSVQLGSVGLNETLVVRLESLRDKIGIDADNWLYILQKRGVTETIQLSETDADDLIRRLGTKLAEKNKKEQEKATQQEERETENEPETTAEPEPTVESDPEPTPEPEQETPQPEAPSPPDRPDWSSDHGPIRDDQIQEITSLIEYIKEDSDDQWNMLSAICAKRHVSTLNELTVDQANEIIQKLRGIQVDLEAKEWNPLESSEAKSLESTETESDTETETASETPKPPFNADGRSDDMQAIVAAGSHPAIHPSQPSVISESELSESLKLANPEPVKAKRGRPKKS